jgi:tetratricopeptide (TPR) repeat protein
MAMAQRTQTSSSRKTFNRLMRLGHAARAEGLYQEAHTVWRQAAMLQPDNEQVWQALLQVIENDEDRRVCLRNILAINPQNPYAREMLEETYGIDDPLAAVHGHRIERSNLRYEVLLRLVQSLLLGWLMALAIIGVQFISFG